MISSGHEGSGATRADFARQPTDAEVSARQAYRFLALAFVVGVSLVIAASIRWGWAWTGFPDNGTFWAWLSLLALPVALAVLPIWLKTRERHSPMWRIGLLIVAGLFLVVVVGGYAFRWSWVGFYRGSAGGTVQLWDWLTALVQPAAVVLIPFWLGLRHASRRRIATLVGSASLLFLVVVVCGYAVPWEWTGFTGQRLWDWIQNFVVPFALPLALAVLDVDALASLHASRSKDGEPARPRRGTGRSRAEPGIMMITALLVAGVVGLAVWSHGNAGTTRAAPMSLQTRALVWERVPGPIGQSSAGATAAAYKGQIWVAGGMGARVRIYDPATRRWRDGPSLPSVRTLGTLVGDGQELYYIGGIGDDGRGLRTVYELDPSRATWRDGPLLPEGRFSGAAAWDGRRVVFGGGTADINRRSSPASDVWALESGEWVPTRPLTRPREHLAATSDGSGTVWFAGGATRAGGMYGDVDAVAGTSVTATKPLPHPLEGLSAVWTISSGICSIAGSTTPPNKTHHPVATVTCERGRSWPNLPRPAYLPAAAVVDGTVYVIAGSDMFLMHVTP